MTTENKMDYLNQVIQEWRHQNNDELVLKDLDKIASTLLNLITEANTWDYECNKAKIKDINSFILSIFLDAYGISDFLCIKIGYIDLLITRAFLKNENASNELFKFHNNFNNKIRSNNKILDIYTAIQKTYWISILKENRDLKNKDAEIKLWFKEVYDNKKLTNEKKGNIMLIFLYVISGYSNWNNIKKIIKNNEEFLVKIKSYFEYLTEENQKSFSFLARLFEWFYILSIWKESDNNKKEIAHYTNLESLDAILKSGKLKFSILKTLNDKDENQLLDIEKAKNIFTFSLTNKIDSLDLFGNYTQMEGISIIFNKERLLNRLNGLTTLKSKDSYSMSFFDINNIIYENEPQININKITKDIKDTTKSFLPNWAIDQGLIGAKKYLNYFLKKKPWEYEDEMRIAINIPNVDIDNKIISGEKKGDAIFLNCDLKTNKLIKKIIIGPKIKKSEFKQKILRNILKEYNLSEIPIIETEANYIE